MSVAEPGRTPIARLPAARAWTWALPHGHGAPPAPERRARRARAQPMCRAMSSVERGVLDHPFHELIERDAGMCRELGHKRRLGHSRLRVDFEADQPSRPLNPVVVA